MKKQLLAFAVASLGLTPGFSQEAYWQQSVDYSMEISMDEEKHQFQGAQSLKYTNNSPDTLHKVFYHLYFNAFQPGSMMDVRSRNILDADPRVGNRISKLLNEEIGYHEIGSLTQDGKPTNYAVSGTILEVKLDHPILPGTTSTLEMTFESQIPLQIRRSGRDNKEGIDYSMAQWYPKLCEYDTDGWHSNPYVGREFHGVWGNFDVKIDIDSKYVLGGTGVIQNPKEVKNGYMGYKGKPVEDRVQWHFKAENVHDFMWAADPEYVHLQTKGPNKMDLHFLVQQDTTYFENWKKLPELTAQAFTIMNNLFGEYEYPQYSVIQGGDGGMEYPMGTLITGNRKMGSLLGVTVHELIHSWYQGMLATNEAKYPWMDEGFTTFASSVVLSKINESPMNFAGSIQGYQRLAKSGNQEPLTTHADHYHTNFGYGVASYTMGSLVPVQLMHIIGEDAFFKGMKDYHAQWAYKHPRPDNFKRVMERASGIELDWFFENWIGTTKHIDYGITDVKKTFSNYEISLENMGQMPMPISVELEFKNGETQKYYIPLRITRGVREFTDGTIVAEEWPWTNPNYILLLPKKIGKIKTVRLFPENLVPDVNSENNIFELK